MEGPKAEMGRQPHNKNIVVGSVVILFFLTAIIFIGVFGWMEMKVEIRELRQRLDTKKLCSPQNDNMIVKREVISSSSTVNLQALLLTQLQDKVNSIQNQCQIGDSDLKREISALSSKLTSESSLVQKQLGDFRQQISTELKMIDKKFGKINGTIASLQGNYADISCAYGYRLNPHRGTCTRFVKMELNWHDAKSYCERAGEYLASFDTVESASWFRHQQLTAGWTGSSWISGRRDYYNSEYRWNGINTGPVTISYWAEGEPNYSANSACFGSWEPKHYYWDDNNCDHKRYFLCEQKSV